MNLILLIFYWGAKKILEDNKELSWLPLKTSM